MKQEKNNTNKNAGKHNAVENISKHVSTIFAAFDIHICHCTAVPFVRNNTHRPKLLMPIRALEGGDPRDVTS